jgi:hypothetical protein
MIKGSCLCGGVCFETDAQLRPVIACHCSQCRKQSGHFWAATSVPRAELRLVRSVTLAWYAASDLAERGFCTGCGAFLFWQAKGSTDMSFAAGAIDGPTGLQIAAQWHEADAGDYYNGGPTEAAVLHGACLCGANRFSLAGPMGEVWGCHCRQCRKTSGHFSASFDADLAQVIWAARSVHQHVSPTGGIRSFCPTCGSGLTFESAAETSVEAGVIDNPTGGRLTRHIFVAQKGDYYVLEDGLPQVD